MSARLARIIALLSVLLLSACVYSDSKLLDARAGARLLPAQAWVLSDAGRGWTTSLAGDEYSLESGGKLVKWKEASFHPLPGYAGVFIMQGEWDKKGKAGYFLFFKSGRTLVYLQPLTEWPELAKSEGLQGITPDGSSAVNVSSREALMRLMQAQVNQFVVRYRQRADESLETIMMRYASSLTGDQRDVAVFRIYDPEVAGDRLRVLALLAKEGGKAPADTDSGTRQAEGGKADAPQQQAAPKGNWQYREQKDPISDELVRYVVGQPEQADGVSGQPWIRIACTRNAVDVDVYWGARLADLYPDGEVDAVRVIARFGTEEPLHLGWAVSRDFTTTSAPGEGAAAFASFADSMLSAIVPGRTPVNFGWKAHGLSQAMKVTAANGQRMALRASNVSGGNTTLIFNMAGYDQIARQKLPSHCH